MQKTYPMQELNEPLLNYCYSSICFGEFVEESKKTNNRIKDKRENPDYYQIFATENKSAFDLYKTQIETLNNNPNDNADDKIRKIKEKINKVNSVIGINFNKKEVMDTIDEEKILYLLKRAVMDPIKTILWKDLNLTHLLAVYQNDYIFTSFGIIYNIIKLMKKNEEIKCGNLSVKYLLNKTF